MEIRRKNRRMVVVVVMVFITGERPGVVLMDQLHFWQIFIAGRKL